MDPPQCVQNAMMKQTKKPFTYTPGGIDLSEIKSPRMARRIERNAAYEGVPEAPRPAGSQAPSGPLPPSALAAMQPQMHVQVFPSGPAPQGPRGGAPPPPPPPSNIPPPPPAPLQPLPTQKVVTSENQVLERPDMTKIIPDNPMALLRKTGGPQPRTSFVEEMYNAQPQFRPPPVQQQQRSPPAQQPQQQWSPPTQQPQQQWSPPTQQRSPPQPQQWSPPAQQPQQQWSPPVQQSQQQWSPVQRPQPQKTPQPQWSPPIIERNQEQPKYQPPVIERNGTRQEEVGQPIKTSTAHLGSLYIPPINQQQPQKRPPSPPRRDPQSPKAESPSTPTLKEAPKPWQRQQQSQDLPPWAKREAATSPAPYTPEPAQNSQPPPPVQQQRSPQPYVRPQSQANQQSPKPASPNAGSNAVYVTQPVILQHPGPQKNRQQPPPQQQKPTPKVDAQGAMIIPIQIEGGKKSPSTPITPGNERSFNRQQSYNSNPTQSNTFKIIQKITNTDGDDEDEDGPVVEHPPKYTQQFQQTPPAEQMRKLKLAEGDRELVNRFRQGVDDDTYLRNEVDPRYMGPAIPSKAFKLLQTMTDGPSDSSATPGATVSRGPPGGNRSPQVTNIPIQIESNDQPKNYVHPSQQTVPEPKKYMGSSIPSRSFKILQAMTAPDSCANANEVNENYDPSSYSKRGYDPNFPPPPPPPPPPFWHSYYYNYYYPEPQIKDESNDKNPRQTPVPFWGYYPPTYPYMQRPPPMTDVESETETGRNTPLPTGRNTPLPTGRITPLPTGRNTPLPTGRITPLPTGRNTPLPTGRKTPLPSGRNTPLPTGRNTPLPFWGYYPYGAPPPGGNEGEDWDCYPQETQDQPYQYPPYWDPYCYSYHYGYPPVYSPYPFYGFSSDSEDLGGYSSTDEMAYFNREAKVERATTPKIVLTPTVLKQSEQWQAYNKEEQQAYNKEESQAYKKEEERAYKKEDRQAYKKGDDSEVDSEVDSEIDSDSETEVEEDDEDFKPSSSQGGLQAIKSVKDINIYDNDEQNRSDEEPYVEEVSEDENDDSASVYIVEDDAIPHELSVIYEVSERSDASKRESSVMSDSTTIGDKSDGEEDEEENSISVNLPLKLHFNISDSRELGGAHADEDKASELYASFTLKSPSSTPREDRSLCRFDSEEKSVGEVAATNKENEYVGEDAAIVQDEPKKDSKEGAKEEEEEEDWWGILKKDEDDFCVTKRKLIPSLEGSVEGVANEESPREASPTSENVKTVETPVGVDGDAGKKLDEAFEEHADIDGDNDKKRDETVETPVGVDGDSNKKPDEAVGEHNGIDCDSDNKRDETVETLVGIDGESDKERDEAGINGDGDKKLDDNVNADDDDASSTSSSDSSSSESDASKKPAENDEDSSSDSDEEDEGMKNQPAEKEEKPELMSIKERIESLKESIRQKQNRLKEETEIKGSVKEKVTAIEAGAVQTSTKSSLKSFEEYSEEEGDSGVTSDMSRHISDNEEFPELKKMTRYQRAATHSRLFKLLQDECREDDDEPEPEVEPETKVDKFSKLSVRQRVSIEKEETVVRRDQLTLPLKVASDADSFSSSGITSPGSPVNDRLVTELVQSMLKRNKGHVFRSLPKEKLQAAAKKILQEEVDDMSTPDSCFLSPLRNSTESSTPAQTPQEFYYDYKQYYESWSDAGRLYDETYDILPSKAFKLLQEHSGLNKTGAIAGLLAKCPKILSSKNVHQELMKLAECPESPTPEKSLEPSDVTSAS